MSIGRALLGIAIILIMLVIAIPISNALRKAGAPIIP